MVTIPRTCEELARTVRAPDVGAIRDARVLAAKSLYSLRVANGHLLSTRECQRRQREFLARKR